jgi:rare lipoprotein A
MKSLLVTVLLFAVSISACGRRDRYVRVIEPSPPKQIILPEKPDGGPPQSYVVNGVRYYPLPDSVGYVETGKASWYGKKFHGRPTASGEIFNMYEPTAAHKTLPLGTYVRVDNLHNRKQVVLRVNDRGPFVKGRIIDLSYKAAKEIGMIGRGVAEVKVTALGREVKMADSSSHSQAVVEVADLKNGVFSVQIGAFQYEKNAHALADRLRVIFDHVDVVRYINQDNRVFFRVWVTKSGSLREAEEMENRLKRMGFIEAYVVRM